MDERARTQLSERFMALGAEKRETFLRRLREQGLSIAELPIPRAPEQQSAPLTHAQERLWFLWRLTPDSAAYNIAGALRLGGALQLPSLWAALEQVVVRHDALRTELFEEDGQARQRVTNARLSRSAVIDLSQEPAPLEAAERRALELMREPFDLQRAPLLRASVLRLAEDDHVLVLCVHHIAADGWSLDVIMREVAAQYAGAPRELPAPAVRYVDYARFCRAVLTESEVALAIAPLCEGLGDVDSVLDLPREGRRPENPGEAAGVVSLSLPPRLVQRLHGFARERGCTLFTVLLSAYGLLLSRYSGQRQLRVGVPVANRSRSQLQEVVGLFVNTLVVPVEVCGSADFAEHVASVEREVRRRQAAEDLPFERLVEALAPTRSLDKNPLFQALFNHQLRDQRAIALPGLRAELMPWVTSVAQVDLALDTEQEGESALRVRFTYARELLTHALVAQMAEQWVALLDAGSAQPGCKLCDLGREDVRAALPRSAAEYLPVTELIWQQARQRPTAPAVCEDDGSGTLTYADLHRRVGRLARGLRARVKATGELRIAVQLRRGTALILAELAVLEAGFAFVPVDPDLPAQRVQELLCAARPALVWTDAFSRQTLEGADVRSITTEELLDQTALQQTWPAPHPERLAYLIFTSGSTGTPKGVAMTHGSLSMHCRAIATAYGMTPSDCSLHFAAASFDASIEQWISPLLSGARLVVRGPELYSADRALEVLRERGVTWFEMPPAYLVEICRVAIERGQTLALRACSVGGEALARQGFDLVMRALDGSPLVNGYGPTETAITPLIWTAQPGDGFESAYAPIGAPVGERAAYVLDTDLCQVPAGVSGELYLGAGGLARGYFERAALTAERFVPDPFGASGSRMYRTGDVVRLRADGQLDFMGRTDHQVKLRGFRIELGEIEARLVKCEGVREAVVIAQGKARTERLVAYLGVGDGADCADAVRRALEAQLPAYMVPSAIVCLPQLPRNASGKVNRRALPEHEPSKRGARERALPQTAAEQALARVLCDVLKLSEVYADDNFFELGGDSIIALQVISRARDAGLALTPKDIFVHRSLASLAAAAQPLSAASRARREAAEALHGEFPLSPVGHAFFSEPFVRRDHYNQALLLGVAAPLELARLSRALDALVAHHDALRVRFTQGAEGAVSQRYGSVYDHAGELLHAAAVRDADELAQVYAATQRSLDLARGPLLRALYVTQADGSARLLLVVHHLVVDGVSWRVLVQDLLSAYQQLGAASSVRLPDKTASWAAFTRGLLGWSQQPARLAAELEHYRRQLVGPFAELPVCASDPSPGALSRDRAFAELSLTREQTARLLRDAPGAYRTHIHELLLTALARALSALTGQSRALIELESHGRQGADLVAPALDVSRTVGWFTCLYPVCLDAGGELSDTIVRVKETLRAVPRHGLGWGLLAQHGSPEQRRERQQLPAARITFNYQGQFHAEHAADGGLYPVREPSGPLCDPDAPLGNWLEINGQVFDGVLSLTFAYSRALHTPHTIEALRDHTLAELAAVIEHTTTLGAGALTPSDIGLVRLSPATLSRLSAAQPGMSDVYPLTPLQRGMLFQSLLAPELATYVAQLDLRVQRLDVPRFVTAFRDVLARHDSLRAAFEHAGLEEPLQVIVREVDVPVEQHDLRGERDEAALAARLRALCEAERARGVPLDRAPLMRLCLIRLEGDAHHVIWTHHHLLLDGWSTSLFWGEVLRAYAGEPSAPQQSAYRDYLAWLGARDAATDEVYFRRLIERAADRSLLTAATTPAAQHAGPHYQLQRVRLDAAATERLRRFARRQYVTVNSVVQAAFGYLLQRYTDAPGALFGVTVAGRPPELPSSDTLLGMFINTVPVHVAGGAHQTVSALVQGVQRDNAELREHEYAPLYEIQRWAGQPGEDLFDALLVFENYPASSSLEQHGAALGFSQIRSVEQTPYALTLSVRLDAELTMDFGFTPKLCAAFVAQLAQRLSALLSQFVDDPERALGGLTVFDASTRCEAQPALALACLPPGAALSPGTFWVLDAHLERVPQGVAGELYIEASLLARGDHAGARVAAEQFLPSRDGRRVYRTGERARICAEGKLELLGRREQQVKLRGARVSLAELEAVLRAQPGVQDAVALMQSDRGAHTLFAVVASGGAALDAQRLREAARRALPTQLWPSHVTVLEVLPRTAQGELDRARLSQLQVERRLHRAPRSETELLLARLFEELLSVADPGLDDEFFELGGDSLLAMRLCARVKQQLGVDLSLPALFESPSVAALAERLAELAPSGAVQDEIEAALSEVADLDPEALAALLETLDEESN